jgi:putative spermidine/putrescine transport system ATP-binding protein
VRGTNGSAGFSFANATLRATMVNAAPGAAVAAIRPEDLIPTADGQISARVETAEYRGREFYGTARTEDGTELFFRSEHRATPGETLRLGADPARVLVYAA